MTFDNPNTPRPPCGPMNPDGGELAIAQFLAASRRYLDITAKGSAGHSDGAAPEASSADAGAARRKRHPPDYRGLLSSVLLASTLGLGGVSSSFASAHSAPRSAAPGTQHTRLPAGETPPQEP